MSTESNKVPIEDKSKLVTAPVKCINEKCNFFGDPSKMNYCSVCYKEYLKTHSESQAETSNDNKSTGSDKDKINMKTRCDKCHKKVGFLGFKCKCGNIYCNEHRDFDRHECSYDYRTESKSILSENNPKIYNPKVESI